MTLSHCPEKQQHKYHQEVGSVVKEEMWHQNDRGMQDNEIK